MCSDRNILKMADKTKDEYLTIVTDQIKKIKNSRFEERWDIKDKSDYIEQQIDQFKEHFNINIVEEKQEQYIAILRLELRRNVLINFLEKENILLSIKHNDEDYFNMLNEVIDKDFESILRLKNIYNLRNRMIIALENNIDSYRDHLHYPDTFSEKLKHEKKHISKLCREIVIIDDKINIVSNELKKDKADKNYSKENKDKIFPGSQADLARSIIYNPGTQNILKEIKSRTDIIIKKYTHYIHYSKKIPWVLDREKLEDEMDKTINTPEKPKFYMFNFQTNEVVKLK